MHEILLPPDIKRLTTLDVSRTASFETTLVRLSVRPSLRPSLSFLKIVSLVFSDIVHGDS